jgi:hypothetical protein
VIVVLVDTRRLLVTFAINGFAQKDGKAVEYEPVAIVLVVFFLKF